MSYLLSYGYCSKELELFNLILAFGLKLKDFHQAELELELKDFEEVELELKEN